MGKDITGVRRKRIQRFFRGLHGPDLKRPTWREMGHFIEGVSFTLKRLYEADGDGNVAQTNCGYAAEGTLQPAQVTIPDYREHLSWLTGKKPTAILTGDDQLWIFDYYDTGRKSTVDNRLSIVTDVGYDSPAEAAFATVVGWIPAFQILQVKDVKIVNGQLTYTTVKKLFTDAEIASLGDTITFNA